MQANPRTLQQVLQGDRQFVVPVYQRPYVWTQEKHWEPLWADVETTAIRLAEARSDAHARGVPFAEADKGAAPHFIGAIVAEQYPSSTGDVDRRSVVDGQQRMTTVQLLLRGVLDALEDAGVAGPLAAKVRKLVQNDEDVVTGDALYKVLPRPSEQAAFRVAIGKTRPAGDESRFAAARTFFASAAQEFIADDGVPSDPYSVEIPGVMRASLLVSTLLGLVKLVAIDLDDEDDAQVIFEALNARGTPLSATDLVKNLLFMRAQLAHEDPQALYDEVWKRFDDDAEWWRKEVGVGHAQRARQDWLLGDWLIAQRGRVINVGRLYGEFRTWLDTSKTTAVEALQTLDQYADAYEALHGRRPGATQTEVEAYDRINRLGITVATPLLLWLLVQPEDRLPVAERELAFRAVESYVVRRMAVKWQTRAYGQAFADVLRAALAAQGSPARAVIDSLEAGPHGYTWPADADLTSAFETSRYYGPGGVNQGRLRMLLGAVDADLQRGVHKGEPVTPDYDQLQVEHVIPRSWEKHWPVQADDENERIVLGQNRESHVNRIGNLTLASDRLNPSMGNDPWERKRGQLRDHSFLRINALLCGEEAWNEEMIVERGRWLAARVAGVWPGPDSEAWDTADTVE